MGIIIEGNGEDRAIITITQMEGCRIKTNNKGNIILDAPRTTLELLGMMLHDDFCEEED